MIYENNFALAGTTALMYNVWFQDLFNEDGSKKNPSLEDVGFRYKKTSVSTWNEYSIKEQGRIFNNISAILEEGTLSENIYVQRYRVYKNYIYPCRILIEGLDSETSYQIESYYTINGQKTFYNRQTISTLPDTSNISYDEITWSSVNPVPEDKKEEARMIVESALSEMTKIYRMFCPVEWHFSPSCYWVDDGIAADSSMTINVRNVDSYEARTVLVHEMAHNFFIQNRNEQASDIIKFMEFATGVEGAMWKDTGLHNYPIISSARYSYMDDCLVAAACWVSKQNT